MMAILMLKKKTNCVHQILTLAFYDMHVNNALHIVNAANELKWEARQRWECLLLLNWISHRIAVRTFILIAWIEHEHSISWNIWSPFTIITFSKEIKRNIQKQHSRHWTLAADNMFVCLGCAFKHANFNVCERENALLFCSWKILKWKEISKKKIKLIGR